MHIETRKLAKNHAGKFLKEAYRSIKSSKAEMKSTSHKYENLLISCWAETTSNLRAAGYCKIMDSIIAFVRLSWHVSHCCRHCTCVELLVNPLIWKLKWIILVWRKLVSRKESFRSLKLRSIWGHLLKNTPLTDN